MFTGMMRKQQQVLQAYLHDCGHSLLHCICHVLVGREQQLHLRLLCIGTSWTVDKGDHIVKIMPYRIVTNKPCSETAA